MIEEFSDDALFPSCVTSAKPNGYGAKPVYSSIPLVFIFHCLKTFDTFVQRFVTDAFRVPDGLPVVFLTSDFHIRLVCNLLFFQQRYIFVSTGIPQGEPVLAVFRMCLAHA